MIINLRTGTSQFNEEERSRMAQRIVEMENLRETITQRLEDPVFKDDPDLLASLASWDKLIAHCQEVFTLITATPDLRAAAIEFTEKKIELMQQHLRSFKWYKSQIPYDLLPEYAKNAEPGIVSTINGERQRLKILKENAAE